MEGKNWFKAQPMGVNKFNNIMKDMTQAAGLLSKTNHCSKKTSSSKTAGQWSSSQQDIKSY